MEFPIAYARTPAIRNRILLSAKCLEEMPAVTRPPVITAGASRSLVLLSEAVGRSVCGCHLRQRLPPVPWNVGCTKRLVIVPRDRGNEHEVTLAMIIGDHLDENAVVGGVEADFHELAFELADGDVESTGGENGHRNKSGDGQR